MTVMSEETALEECSGDGGGSPEIDGQSFSSALEQISKQEPDNRNFATHILTWLKFAKERPTAAELVQSYAIQQTKDASNRDLDRPEEDITSVCKGLVTMDPSTKIVQAAHKSVLGRAQECGLVHPDPPSYILGACLTYLQYDELATPMSCETEINIRLQKYSFLQYAAARLMSDPGAGTKEAEAKALTRFLQDNSRATSWYQVVARSPKVRITGLHAAIHMSRPTIANALLKPGKGGNVNVKDSRGETPLHWAAARQHPPLVRLLLKNSPRLHCKDSRGDTPLHKAVIPWHGRHPNAQILTVYELVRRGGRGAAQINISNSFGRTPIDLAKKHGRDKLARFLVFCQAVKSIGDVSRPTRDPKSWYPLIEAVRNGDEYWARALLQSGVPVDIEDEQGMTPLRRAIVSDKKFLVGLLLENGADVNYTYEEEITPLMEACRLGRSDIVSLLLGWGANPNDRNQDGFTALHYAAGLLPGSHYKQSTYYLLDKQADPSIRNCRGLSALDIAATNGDADIVRLLLAHGARTMHRTAQRDMFSSALHLASLHGHVDSIKQLACSEVFREAKDMQDATGATALHRAVGSPKSSRLRTMTALVDLGVDLDVRDNKGRTPLMLAYADYMQSEMDMLLRNGADMNFKAETQTARDFPQTRGYYMW